MAAKLIDVSGLRVAVVGDPIVDRYVHAQPARLSREAPVLVLRHERDELKPGGAANAACNLLALGAQVRLLGFVGADGSGRELAELLEARGIDVSGLVQVLGWDTPTKTRVQAAEPRRTPQQVLRIDREPRGVPGAREQQRLALALRALAGHIDALIVSDYDYGVANAPVAAAVARLRAAGVLTIVDPRRSMRLFRGADAMTPNREELALHVGLPVDALDEPRVFARALRQVLREARPRWLLVTQGNRGMALYGRELGARGWRVPASGPEQIVDVTGAGDTAAAAFALALAAGRAPADAMRVANAAAGVVVMKLGAATCDARELARALRDSPQPEPIA